MVNYHNRWRNYDHRTDSTNSYGTQTLQRSEFRITRSRLIADIASSLFTLIPHWHTCKTSGDSRSSSVYLCRAKSSTTVYDLLVGNEWILTVAHTRLSRGWGLPHLTNAVVRYGSAVYHWCSLQQIESCGFKWMSLQSTRLQFHIYT